MIDFVDLANFQPQSGAQLLGQHGPPKSIFTVDHDALMVAQAAEFVRVDLVFLRLGVIDVAPARIETP
jgi:hypothetical protein